MADARIPCMTTAFDDTGQHPVTSTIAAVSRQLDEVADLGLWTLRPAETETNLTALAAAPAPDHRARAPPRPPRRPPRPRRSSHGATDTAAWWANQTRQTKRDAKRRLALANALDCDHEPVRDAMAAGQRLRGAGGGDREGRRRVAGRAPPRRRGPPDRVRGRARPGRAAPARAPGPRGGRPRDRRRTRAQGPATPGSARRGGLPVHHRRRRPRPVPRPVHPPGHRSVPCSSRRCSRSTHPGTATTPAPPRGSGTRSASTSPATRSTGSPRPAASTPPWWSP